MQENFSEKSKLKFFKTQKYWRSIDKHILFSFFLLFILGLFFSFSSTSFLADERLNKDYYFFFQKHLLYASASFIIMIFISNINLDLLNKSLLPIFLIFFISLVLVPFIGVEVKGSKRWLDFFYFRFQPIEFVKPFYVLMFAKIITSNSIKNLNLSYLFSFFLLSVIVFFLIGQPDLGQSVLLICTWISLIFVSGVNIYFLIFFFISMIFLFSGLLYLFPERFSYIFERITSFLDPKTGQYSQSQKAIEAIRQGNLKGQGMGEGILKERVPEAHTDYIISVISEEFGSIISIFIILIFLYIAFRIIKKILQFSNSFYKLSLCGLASLLIFQAFIHVSVNVNLLPTTGMTLPFLSYGGSSILSSGIIAGIILNYTSLGEK